MGKNDMMRGGWAYPVCDECGMADNSCNTCNTCGNAATGCSACANTAAPACNACDTCSACAAPAAPCAAANDEMHVYFDSCDGLKEVAMNCECQNDESIGRVLDVNVKLCNVCPGRSSAVGVHLVELDQAGNEYTRGFRAVNVPAHNASANRDLALPTQRFILPDGVSACNGRRHFIVRTTNHYVEMPNQCGW